MKKLSIIVLSACAILSAISAEARSYRSSPSDVHVNGYTRSNGTYVSPHYRSAPDGNPYNNYGSGD